MTPTPRVVLNALALRPGGSGVQRSLRELLAALPAAVEASLGAWVQRDALAELPEQIEPLPFPVARGLGRAWRGQLGRPRADLYHGLDAQLPLRTSSASVVTVNDLSVFDVPWTHPRAHRLGRRWLTARAVRQADVLIAPSAFTAERIWARFRRECRIVHLAPPSGLSPASREDIHRVRRRYRLPERFVLHVGNLEPRKAVPVLAEACREARVRLVLAGADRGARAPAGAQALGWVPEADLAALYGAATLVACVSRYEGFALPAVEAMACGTAVVATRCGALPQVAPEAAGFVAAGDVDDTARLLARLLADAEQRQALAEAGRRAAGALRWSDTARAVAGVYRELGVG